MEKIGEGWMEAVDAWVIVNIFNIANVFNIVYISETKTPAAVISDIAEAIAKVSFTLILAKIPVLELSKMGCIQA